MPFLTVFTPAYNRAHTLERTYKSLKRQSCKEFIWLIVDDGSSDNTAAIVESWRETEREFEIRYIYKENGGMHTAHNVAYANIDTELNVCIDSDDEMAADAVQKIKDKWKEIKSRHYAGIIGLDADMNTGKVIGTRFADNQTETTLCGFHASGGWGDKKLVYRTEVIKQYPDYPVFDGEKYVALEYKYRLIDQNYKLAILDEVLCNVEYQPDGSTNTMFRQYMQNPKGFAFWRKVCMQYPESRKRLLLDCVHYVAESILAKDAYFVSHSPKKVMTVLAVPFGIVLYHHILKKTKK